MALTSRMRRIAATIASATVISLFAGATPAVAQSPLSSLVSAISVNDRQLQELEGVIGSLQQAGNRALVDLRDAQFKSREANELANEAHQALEFSTAALAKAQERLNELSRSTYRTQGTGTTVAGATTAGDALDRNTFLRQQVEDQQEVVDDLERQRSEHANAAAKARETQEEAELREQEVQQQEEEARITIEESAAELEEKTAEREELTQEHDSAAQQLAEQRGTSTEETATFAAEPVEQEAAETEPVAAEAEPEESSLSSTSNSDNEVVGSSDAIETAIARAQSQIGVPYAWGGGDANGPTSGIRDGGIGDANGDFGKVGFDCSGLVLYAFAAVGMDLPHYTGYQYLRGTPVDHADVQRGDLIFYGPNGSQHVAIYLGDGMMLEAPSSGGHVQETPVRWNGLSENAVRLI